MSALSRVSSLFSCLWSASSLLSTSPRDRRPGLDKGMLRRLGAGAGHRGNSWYWRPRLSPQKLKILDTPEKAPDKGLQVSLFSPSSVKGSPPGGSPGGLGLEKGTRRRGLELRPGPSSSLLSGLEGPLDGLSPHGPPGCPRQLGPGPTRAGPCPRADTSPGCSVSLSVRLRNDSLRLRCLLKPLSSSALPGEPGIMLVSRRLKVISRLDQK